ncbi:hypothetical protein AGR6A_pb0025 [Agrobacterium sp. NCPPB 925]|nr:hypothetical protein AGR6A_pb0025 [Agrobacterium sp. NCPPB 925]
MSKHDDWLKAAEDACSYRRMYALALEISIETIDPQLKAAADGVVEVLKDVVGLALASSDILKEARRRFTVLTNALAGAPEMEQFVTSAGSPAEQVEELLCQILEKVASRTAHELPAIRTMRSDMKPTRRASPRGW